MRGFRCPVCGFTCPHEEHRVCPRCRYEIRARAEVLTIEVDLDDIVFVGTDPRTVIEEDIELIIRKKRFRDILKEIGRKRFREALEELYMRQGAIARVARVIGISDTALRGMWFPRLGISYVFRPPKVVKMEIIGWRRIPEVAYVVPRLYFEEAPFEERVFACGLDEGEGSHAICWDKTRRRYIPTFTLSMRDPKPVKRVGKLFGLKPYLTDVERPEGTVKQHGIHTTGSPAISIADYVLTHLTPESVRYGQAERQIKLFGKWMSLTEEEYKKAMELE